MIPQFDIIHHTSICILLDDIYNNKYSWAHCNMVQSNKILQIAYQQ